MFETGWNFPWFDSSDEGGSTFSIQDKCSTVQAEKDCNDLCAWRPATQTCVPEGLFVKDTNDAVYTLDTGSGIASYSSDYCEARNIATSGTPIIRNYGRFTNVHDTPTKYPHTLLGTLMHPTCSSEHIPGTPQALVGVSTSKQDNVKPHALMNNVRPGQRRLVVDKAAGTVCIGCHKPAIDWQPFVEVSQILDFVAVESDTGKLILDTGSTVTSKLAEGVCLVGYEDIRYLNVDYDRAQVSYEIDTDRVEQVCGPSAPVKLNYGGGA